MGAAAILLAGGSGTRMRRADTKVFATVGGRPLLQWSLRAFADCEAIDRVVLVIRDEDRPRIDALLRDTGLAASVRTVVGGANRQASERAGLEAIAGDIDSGAVDTVAIHDSARPFVTTGLIGRVVASARRVGGAVPVLELGDGVYRATPDGRLVLQARDLHRVQTPQAFRSRALLEAYRAASHQGFAGVDTVETVARYTDLQIAAEPGDTDNLKVTFAADLATAERIAAERERGVSRHPAR
ncbi:MAG TPA: IspD/TarI family cytidylyltransferase [Euzebyales bacterium]